MMQPKPSILLVPGHFASMPEMIYIADALSEQFEPVFWFNNLKSAFDRWMIEIKAKDYKYFCTDNNVFRCEQIEVDPRDKRNFIRRITAKIPIVETLVKIIDRIRRIRSILISLNPCIIIIKDDLGYLNRLLLSVSTKNGIPSLIIPSASSRYVMYHFSNILKDSDMYSINTNWKKLVAKLYPRAVMKYKEKKYLPDRSIDIIVENILGIYPSNPWIIGGGKSSFVAIASQGDYDRYTSYGILPQKLKITGQLESDELWKAYNYRHTTSRKSKLVLYGVSPLPEHNYLDWETHLETMKSVIRVLQECMCDIRLCLHPGHPKEPYLQLAEQMQVAVEPRPLIEVLPDADIYLTWYSTTIPWALALGVAVLNLDIYTEKGLLSEKVNDFVNFSGFNGFISINNINDIHDLVKEILTGTDFQTRLKQSAIEYHQYIGVFDGKAGERLVSLVLDIISKTGCI